MTKLISIKSAIASLLLGLACWLSFSLIGSRIDSEGFLHEPFALVPLGWLFFLISFVIVVLCLGRALYRRFFTHHKAA